MNPDADARLGQFRKMAADDPDNELGHLSLGRELMNAGEYAEAAESLRRTIELNDKLSKAYQLLGETLLKLDRPTRRGRGTQAGRAGLGPARRPDARRGDGRAAAGKWARRCPTSANREKWTWAKGQVLDSPNRRSRGQKLRKPPFRNALGRVIFENVSAESWREWIGMGTKVINELRLPLSDPQGAGDLRPAFDRLPEPARERTRRPRRKLAKPRPQGGSGPNLETASTEAGT